MPDLTDKFRACVHDVTLCADDDLVDDILAGMRRRGLVLAEAETLSAIRGLARLMRDVADKAEAPIGETDPGELREGTVMADPLFATTGLTWQERGALRTLGHAFDASGISSAALDARYLTPDQRAFWNGYVVIPHTMRAAGDVARVPASFGRRTVRIDGISRSEGSYEPSGYADDMRAAGRGHLLGDR